jgi:hypothetical protein
MLTTAFFFKHCGYLVVHPIFLAFVHFVLLQNEPKKQDPHKQMISSCAKHKCGRRISLLALAELAGLTNVFTCIQTFLSEGSTSSNTLISSTKSFYNGLVLRKKSPISRVVGGKATTCTAKIEI